MVLGLFLGSLLLAMLPDDSPTPTDADRAAYAKAAAEAGRDAEANVRMALWCESRGMVAERRQHLETAISVDPNHPRARGLLGFISVQGRWVRPEGAVESARGDAERTGHLERYRERREKIPETAEAHRQLAEWCESVGLKDEARVHWMAVVRISPGRDEAWLKLGYKKQHNGRWSTSEGLAAEHAEIDAQKKADARWTSQFQKWKGWLGQRSKRAEAEAALARVVDPRAVPTIWRLFVTNRPEDQLLAIRLLNQIDAPTATQALALLAIFADSAEVRRTAAIHLVTRDPRECAGWLIGLLRDPIQFEVKMVGGPGSPGELYIKGEKVNTRQFYAAPPPLATFRPGDVLSYDAYGLPVANRTVGYSYIDSNAAIGSLQGGGGDLTGLPNVLAKSGLGALGQQAGQKAVQNQASNAQVQAQLNNNPLVGGAGMAAMPSQAQVPVGQLMLQAERQAALSGQQLERDVAMLNQYNKDLANSNERVGLALKYASGEKLDPDRSIWLKWWAEQKETSSASAPIVREPTESAGAFRPGVRASVACFKAGTPVWTEAGLRPIEDLRAGDKVLTQDTATGALALEAVLTIRHASPAPTCAIQVGDATIVATGLERFYVSAKGWVMLDAIQPGDTIRCLDGTIRVNAIEASNPTRVYNIQLAEGRGIFVGRRGLLAHDERPSQPVHAPFDAASARGLPRPVAGH